MRLERHARDPRQDGVADRWRQLGGSNAPRAPVGFTVAELATPLQHLLEQLEQLEGG